VIGVFASKWTEVLAQALCRLGSEHALVVFGTGGLDEISLVDATHVSELKHGQVRSYDITPEQFGFQRCRMVDLEGGDREQAARHVREVLSGTADANRTAFALLNAAAAIYVGGSAESIVDGLVKARESIGSGSAARKLAALVELSNR
jgi:anthranilate phosphoribosyltransferase